MYLVDLHIEKTRKTAQIIFIECCFVSFNFFHHMIFELNLNFNAWESVYTKSSNFEYMSRRFILFVFNWSCCHKQNVQIWSAKCTGCHLFSWNWNFQQSFATPRYRINTLFWATMQIENRNFLSENLRWVNFVYSWISKSGYIQVAIFVNSQAIG